MDQDVLSFEKIRINHDLLEEVWTLDPRQLEHIKGHVLSSYAIALAQYLVYFTYQRNMSKAEQHKKNKYMERKTSLMLSSDPDLLKKYKTKAAAKDFLVSTDEDLMLVQTSLDALYEELMWIEGMDKVISELIATIKRELTRRENELYQVRMERRN
jgi:hypothetical protein